MNPPLLHVATYNIHKGFSQFNRRMVVHELRDSLRTLDPDLLFLQEVQGEHSRHAERHADWPEAAQYEFLADGVWQSRAYGRNVVYDHGHHGNAILSRHPLSDSHNQDVTDLAFERRGLLHSQLRLPGFDVPIHCVCVHLSLLGSSRRRQLDLLAERLDHWAPSMSPLVVAGDFNDWRNRADPLFARRLGLTEVFGGETGRPVRSYPASLPVLRLDRIYVRGFEVISAQLHSGRPWSRISDHAALSARLRPLAG